MIKFPSLNYLVAHAKESLCRFPLTIGVATAAVFIANYLIECNKNLDNVFPYINAMLALSIGIPLFFCATIVAEKKKIDLKKKITLNLLTTVVLVLIYFSLPAKDSTHNTSMPYIKYGIYNVTAHLLVSIMPFLFSRQLNGFWQYNKALFLRILLAVLYSGFIFIGLVLALTALRLLFDLNIPEKLYFEIWVTTIGWFNTWFFVSGIPHDFDELDRNTKYPKGLRIFFQYVLLPLLAIYLLILYSYAGKILVTWNWPKGLVTYLITFVSILGIFTFLLVYPYGHLKEHSWIKRLSRGYYFLLLPLIVLLYIAIFMRIADYGITINRYGILLLAIWITIVSLYSVMGKTNIKFIPISLAIVLIICLLGPWGIFSVSERSQVNRLKNILEKSKILVDEKIQNETIWNKDSLPKLYAKVEWKNNTVLNDSLHNEVMSILDYLDSYHGFEAIQPWYKQDIHAIINQQQASKSKKETYFPTESEIYMRSMGLKNEWRNQFFQSQYTSYNTANKNNITSLDGYEYLVHFDYFVASSKEAPISTFYLNNEKYELIYNPKNKLTLVIKNNRMQYAFELRPLIDKLSSQQDSQSSIEVPVSNMTLFKSQAALDLRLQFETIEIESRKSEKEIKVIKGNLFIKINK